MIFCIETILMVFFGKLRFTVRKNLALPILGPLWYKFGPFWVQHLLKLVCDLGLDLSIVIVYFLKALWNGFVMMLFFSFQMWEQMWELMQTYPKKLWMSALLNLWWRLPSKIDMGKSVMLFFSIPKWWKCENLI